MASVPGCLSFPVLVRLLSVRTHYDRASARNTSTSPGPRAHTYRRIRTAPRPNLSARARASLRRPRRTKRSSGAHTAGHRSPAMAAPVEHATSPRRAQAKPRPRVRLCLCAAHKRPGDACEENVRSCEGGRKGPGSPTEESSRRSDPPWDADAPLAVGSPTAPRRSPARPQPAALVAAAAASHTTRSLYRRTTATRSRPPLTYLHPDAVRGLQSPRPLMTRPSAPHAKHEHNKAWH